MVQVSQADSKKGKSILAIIPARGGSKGIIKKNLRMLGGKPLIGYTIDAAKKSRMLDRIIVSTDDPEIAAFSRENGIGVVIRPDSIAQDKSPITETIEHTLRALGENENSFPEIIVLLQPTSPLRTTEDIDRAVTQFLDTSPESLISVCESEHSPFWCFTIDSGKLAPLFDRRNSELRRQDLPKTYRPNGAIYISTPGKIRMHSGFVMDNTAPFLMPANRSIDIDAPLDLLFAEFLLAKENPV